MKIEIDIDEVIKEFSLSSNTSNMIVQSCVEAVTQEIYRQWVLSASEKLNSTRNEYINSLSIIKLTPYSQTITLSGKLPNMLEKGATPWDMKLEFAKSSKVVPVTRVDSYGNVTSGWYLTIPFRHGTPGIVGENSAFSGIMPQSVYDSARQLKNNESLKKENIASPHDVAQTRKEFTIPSSGKVIPSYTHKSSIYEGIQKKSAAYKNVIQNTYVSFRRVSDVSDPYSWFNKGIEPHNILADALGNVDVDNIVENNVDIILNDLGYGQ